MDIMALIEIPRFNWAGTYKKIELGIKQKHIIECLFELAEVMGGVSFACAAYRVLQLAPQVLEEEKRLNALPSHIYSQSHNGNTVAKTNSIELQDLNPNSSSSKPSSVCGADLI
jgi:hypothetical protein